ncbi:hypothetical protein [Maridesulfovibrio sp. FT414]|uniref:hypothetical protein n=1 Tax=Maridesulfovibrio sp. FT414 TaxID=2979469 RepID=UPI003D8097D9
MLKQILASLCMILALAVAAQASAPLTSSQVERVMAALEELETYTDQMDEEREQSGELEADSLDPEMFSNECTLIYEYSAETKKIIEKHGFNEKTWPETAGRVMKALAYLAVQADSEIGAAEMKEALAQIDSDPSMSQEQKKAMKQQIQAAMSAAEAMMKAPAADLKVVRPFFEKFTSEK